MLERRELCRAERMADVFDRAATLNFCCVIRVRGPLSEAALIGALRSLERRHPLLRARIARSSRAQPSFVFGEGRPIPLQVERGDVSAWKPLAERALAHRVWPDTG